MLRGKLLSFAESGMYPWRTLYSREIMRATVFNYIECDYNRCGGTVGVAASVRNNLKTRTSLGLCPYYVGRIKMPLYGDSQNSPHPSQPPYYARSLSPRKVVISQSIDLIRV